MTFIDCIVANVKENRLQFKPTYYWYYIKDITENTNKTFVSNLDNMYVNKELEKVDIDV